MSVSGLANRKMVIAGALVLLVSIFVHHRIMTMLHLQSQSLKQLQTSIYDGYSLRLSSDDTKTTNLPTSYEVAFEGTSDFLSKLRMKHQRNMDNPPQHCVMNINTIAASQRSKNIIVPSGRTGVQTCGSVKTMADNEVNGSDMCTVLQKQESVCCPSSIENPCEFCEEAGIYNLDLVPPDTGGHSCRSVKVMAAQQVNGSGVCTVLKNQESACCPQQGNVGSPATTARSRFSQSTSNTSSYTASNHCPFCEGSVMADYELDSLRIYNRAINYDWIGRSLPAAESRYSKSEDDSCEFTSMEFSPTEQTLKAALNMKTFLTPYSTAEQCKLFSYYTTRDDSADDCSGTLFRGTLFRRATTLDECLEQSIDKGLNMTISTMANAPAPLLRTFNDSLGSVLPPPPNILYATNVIISEVRFHT